METPDKLHCMHRLNGNYSCSTTPFGGSYEYIRKDALLEWAKEHKEQLKKEAAGCSNMLAAGEWLAYDKLIEKIESL